MSKRMHSLKDSSERAADVLNATLGGFQQEASNATREREGNFNTESLDPHIPVMEARDETLILTPDVDRQKIRLLLFTKDISVLQEGSIPYSRVTDSRNLFLEIHVVLLTYGEQIEAVPSLRLFENVWIYPTNSDSWWTVSHDAYMLAREQMVFGGGFRADVIVAEDPFESGLAGWFLSKKYNRPFQLHVYEDFFDPAYTELLEHPTLYELAVKYLLPRVQSIRTKTEFQRQAVVSEYPKQDAITGLMPNYYNLNVWKDFVPTMSLRDEYPKFKFFILHISSMKTTSHSREVLEGAARILRRYPTAGLIIVGNGPLRSMLERHAIALGVQNQVEFRPMPQETISLMKSAHLFVHVSEDGTEDDLILEAAVTRVPMIGSLFGLSGTLFVDNESACLCAPTDSECIAQKINQYLNENQDRSRFALNASAIVFERIEQDYSAYLNAYCESVVQCIASHS